jgi:hypothetical protein
VKLSKILWQNFIIFIFFSELDLLPMGPNLLCECWKLYIKLPFLLVWTLMSGSFRLWNQETGGWEACYWSCVFLSQYRSNRSIEYKTILTNQKFYR